MSKSIKQQIYLDYMATTPIDPVVLDSMLLYMGVDGVFGNPASLEHSYGMAAAAVIENSREQLALSVGSDPEAIIFTSGATESNNLAILGAANFYKRKGRHLITVTTEHKTVLDSFAHLALNGFEVSYLNPKADGLIDHAELEAAIRDDTLLISVMHVNNEIGVIQDIASIGKMSAARGVLLHVDAAQSAGKLGINLRELSVDLMSFSAHKNYGPKGVGALYVRNKPRLRLQSQSFGGGHEQGLRSGTLPTHQIVGMGEAFALSESLRINEQARILALREYLWQSISVYPQIVLNGHATERVSGNLNLCFTSCDPELLKNALYEFALSTRSACAATAQSYVLKAIGLSTQDAMRSVRLCLGRFTTVNDIERLITRIHGIMK